MILEFQRDIVLNLLGIKNWMKDVAFFQKQNEHLNISKKLFQHTI